MKTLQREVGSSIEAVLPTLEKIATDEATIPTPCARYAVPLPDRPQE